MSLDTHSHEVHYQLAQLNLVSRLFIIEQERRGQLQASYKMVCIHVYFCNYQGYMAKKKSVDGIQPWRTSWQHKGNTETSPNIKQII